MMRHPSWLLTVLTLAACLTTGVVVLAQDKPQTTVHKIIKINSADGVIIIDCVKKTDPNCVDGEIRGKLQTDHKIIVRGKISPQITDLVPGDQVKVTWLPGPDKTIKVTMVEKIEK